MLDLRCKSGLPWQNNTTTTTNNDDVKDDNQKEEKSEVGEGEGEKGGCDAGVEVTEDIREWEYGEYEGLTSTEVGGLKVFIFVFFSPSVFLSRVEEGDGGMKGKRSQRREDAKVVCEDRGEEIWYFCS